MLKGVNRQVVEISQPDSVYFEKVLFFVKPEYTSVDEKRLKARADMLIKNASCPPENKINRSRKSKIIGIVKLAAAAAAGAAATGALSIIF